MAAPIPIFKENEDFHVPHFEVRLRGQKLDPVTVRDVTQVTYRDKIGELDSFDLTLNNWDDAQRKPKYEPASEPRFGKLFDPGQEIELRMGYSSHTRNERLMLRGLITKLETAFTESGPMTVSVSGLNILHKFKKKQHTWAWSEPRRRDTEIAEEICRNPVTEKKPGLGIKLVTDKKAKGAEEPLPFVFMNNQYDIVFLQERARVHGYSMFLDYDQNGKEFLYFGPSQDLHDVTYELTWGTSLVDFKPALTTANQISQVTVLGWDRKKGKAVKGTAKWGDSGLTINRDQQAVALAIDGQHEVITNVPVHSEKEAKEKAKDILRNQLSEMVKATGTTLGLPDLRAGRRVVVKNVGPRFSGEYFITETTHTINDSGYRTNFSARREEKKGGIN
jgi:phage protein D